MSRSEMPLWNAAIGGPDPTDEGGYRWAPYCYNWTPADGPTFSFLFLALDAKPFHIYYARISSANNHNVPAASMRLEFEPSLGDGTEYANYPTQQIIYPYFAGLGSSNFDLGSSGLLPNTNIETYGSFSIYGSPYISNVNASVGFGAGDADFADMVEDVFKSGPIFTGEVTGEIARGLNCCNFPGPIQKKYYYSLEPGGFLPIPYDMPVQVGNQLLVLVAVQAAGPLSIADTLGNTWNLVTSGTTGTSFYSVWTATANASGTTAVDVTPHSGFRFEITILEVPSFDTIDVTNTATGSGLSETLSLTTTNVPTQPDLMLVWSVNGSINNALTQSPPQWDLATDFRQLDGLPTPFNPYTTGYTFLQTRSVYQPGTYTLTNFFSTTVPWAMVGIALKNSQPLALPRSLGDIIDEPTMNLARQQCRAGGLIGSVSLDSQRKGSDWLKDFYACMNTAPVWSGFRLKSIPYSEVSATGNGVVYTAYTSLGPVANLTDTDFIAAPDKPPVTVERKAQVDAPNIWQIEHINRGSDYATVTSSYTDQGSVALYGPRKAQPQTLHEIQDVTVARILLAIQVRRSAYIRNTYKFKLRAKWQLLEPMDLVTITDMQAGIINQPVRLTSIQENDKYELDCEAEPFVYGVHAPNPLLATAAQPNPPSPGISVLPVNTPIILEVPTRMAQNSNIPELWLIVSDADPNYGGCIPTISTNGGSSYQQLTGLNNTGKILGSATTGFTTQDWPASFDPQKLGFLITGGELKVDLTESLGALDSYLPVDENSFKYPCYVEGGTTPTPNVVATLQYSPGPDPVDSFPVSISSISINQNDQVILYVRYRNGYGFFFFGCPQAGGFSGSVNITPGLNPTKMTFNLSGIGKLTPLYSFLGGGIAYDMEATAIIIRGAGQFQTDYAIGPPPTAVLNYFDLRFTNSVTNSWTAYGFYIFPPTAGSPPLFVVFLDSEVIPSWPPAGWTGTDDLLVGLAYQTAAHSTPPAGFYELMCYGEATLTSPYNYTLTGNTTGLQTFYYLNDSSGQTWQFAVSDGGVLTNPGTPVLGRAPDYPYVSMPSDFGIWWLLSVSLAGVMSASRVTSLPIGTANVNPSIPIFSPDGTNYAITVASSPPFSTGTITIIFVHTPITYLRRAVFGMPIPGEGIDHPIASRFAFLDAPENENPQGIMKLKLDPRWLGQSLYFKFLSFNKFGAGLQDASTAFAYSYVPLGFAAAMQISLPYTLNPSLDLLPDISTDPATGISSFAITMGAATAQFPNQLVQYGARAPILQPDGDPFGFQIPFGAVDSIAVSDGGSGYAIGDTGFIQETGATQDAEYVVLSISGGAVTGISLNAPGANSVAGRGYTTANGLATTTGGVQPGGGSGLTVDITAASQISVAVLIFDPAYEGDPPNTATSLSLEALVVQLPTNGSSPNGLGQPGFTYIGSITVFGDLSYIVLPGGWPPQQLKLVNGA